MKCIPWLLALMLLALTNSCNNEDDVIKILTGKNWKLSRMTSKGSSIPFYQGLWSNEAAQKKSLEALGKEGNFIIEFKGSEIDGVISGVSFSARGISATLSGQWNADGKSNSMSIQASQSGTESDPLAKAFIAALLNVYKYEGDVNSLTLYYKDGNTVKVMGFIPK